MNIFLSFPLHKISRPHLSSSSSSFSLLPSLPHFCDFRSLSLLHRNPSPEAAGTAEQAVDATPSSPTPSIRAMLPQTEPISLILVVSSSSSISSVLFFVFWARISKVSTFTIFFKLNFLLMLISHIFLFSFDSFSAYPLRWRVRRDFRQGNPWSSARSLGEIFFSFPTHFPLIFWRDLRGIWNSSLGFGVMSGDYVFDLFSLKVLSFVTVWYVMLLAVLFLLTWLKSV